MADMKADGLDYDERMDKLQEIRIRSHWKTCSKPRSISTATMCRGPTTTGCRRNPWCATWWKTASDFTGYITRYNIARSEGTLLRYLSDAYRTLARTVPPEKRDEQLEDIISWLRVLVRSIDSSLVDEWENAGDSADQSEAAASLAAPGAKARCRGPSWSYRAWCAMPCSAVYGLWTLTSRTSSARSTRTGATACTNGKMCSTTTTTSTSTWACGAGSALARTVHVG